MGISGVLVLLNLRGGDGSIGNRPLEHDPIKIPVLSVGVVAIGLMQQTTVIPQYQIACPPTVSILIFILCRMRQ